ncbi:hypothetical protein Aduo_002404 [Ancylostoma duodenale]
MSTSMAKDDRAPLTPAIVVLASQSPNRLKLMRQMVKAPSKRFPADVNSPIIGFFVAKGTSSHPSHLPPTNCVSE